MERNERNEKDRKTDRQTLSSGTLIKCAVKSPTATRISLSLKKFLIAMKEETGLNTLIQDYNLETPSNDLSDRN